MRKTILIAAAAAPLAGCGNGAADVTCAQLERSAEERRRMTEAVVAATHEGPGKAEAIWATMCANAYEHERARARPYRETVRLIWELP